MSKKRPEPTATKVIKVCLWLRVENNNKHIRGKKKAREEIEPTFRTSPAKYPRIACGLRAQPL